jgi:hypothetical protein
VSFVRVNHAARTVADRQTSVALAGIVICAAIAYIVAKLMGRLE